MCLKFNYYIRLFFFILLAYGVVIPDKPSSKHHHSPHYRQKSRKCDLICPGLPPLALPPDFIQNCSSITNTVTKKPVNTTTPKPTTTTESGEESNEYDESTEKIVETTTKKKSEITKRTKNIRQQNSKNIHQLNQGRKKTQIRKHQQTQNKKHFTKKKVLLKREVKKKLLKHRKHFNGRCLLKGCYIVCADENLPGGSGNDGYQGGYNPAGTVIDEPNSGEADDDNYVEGEDTPIEIIYVPGSARGNQRPFDLYQTNDYALLEPQPAFGYFYDPFLIEGKKKKINRIKQQQEKSKEKKQNDMKKTHS